MNADQILGWRHDQPTDARYVLQLQTDVKNPTPDRRSKDWNKRPVIPAGSRFIVQYGALYETNTRFAGEHENSDLAKLLFAHCVPVEPESVREIQCVDADYDYDYHNRILETLLKMGRITRQDFRDARVVMDGENKESES